VDRGGVFGWQWNDAMMDGNKEREIGVVDVRDVNAYKLSNGIFVDETSHSVA